MRVRKHLAHGPHQGCSMATFGQCGVLVLWALLSMAYSDREHAGKCLSGWVYSPSSHTCIKVYGDWWSQRKSWESARAFCQREGGDLVAIRNEAMNKFVVDTAWAQCPYCLMWIGLNDKENEGTWRWLNDSETATYTNWMKYHPRNDHRNQDCVSVYVSIKLHPKFDRKWFNWRCSFPATFVCEQQSLSYVEAGDCPSGWTQCPSSGTCIKMYKEGSDWQKARAACKKDNGDLLKIRDERMNQFVEDMMESTKVGITWLGLRDLNSGKKFYWLDETKEITYSNWASGYPQTVDNNWKDCVIMGGQEDGKWSITSCIKPISFFCERKPTCHAVDGTCPIGWVKSPTSCIKLYDDHRRWQDARTKCQQDGADLVRVHDDCMSKLIEEQIKSRPADDIFWIGLNDQNEEGKWKWLDDDEPVIYKNWAPGQPSNHQVSGHKKGQDCAEIGSHKKTQWNDQDCTKAHKFICEKPAGSPPKAGVGIIAGIIVAVLALCVAILTAIFFGPRLYHYLKDKFGGKVSGPLSFNNPVADSIQKA